MRGIVVIVSMALLMSCGDDSSETDSAVIVDSGMDISSVDTNQADAAEDVQVAEDTQITDAPEADGPEVDASVVSFAGVIQPIFTASCGSAACHGGASPKQGLNLSSGSAYQSLVDVDSAQCPSLKRVSPGSTADSYLVQKLEGSGSCFTLQKMPVGGSLQPSQIDDIKQWITEGALDN